MKKFFPCFYSNTNDYRELQNGDLKEFEENSKEFKLDFIDLEKIKEPQKKQKK